jgi:hypothetical protein
MSEQVDFSPEQVATHIRDDLDYLAAILIPEAATSPFPAFYKTVWIYILQNLHTLGPQEVFRFALGLPRGYAKTVFLKLLVCYLIIHDYEISFIVIVCATERLAKNFLADVSTMMQNTIISQVYGNWESSLEKDTVDDKRARFNGRLIILVSLSVGTSVRGLNIDNKRPHLIICDDAQTKECDNSDTERAALKQWLVGTLFKCLTKTEKKAILYIGNMYSTECILYMFSKMKAWVSLITGAILADGKVLWEQIQTLQELMDEYEHDNELGEGATWFAEIQNDPTGAACGLLGLGETVPACATIEDPNIYPIKFITVDPSGRKVTSDDNVVATHALVDGEIGVTLKINNGKWSPDQVIDEIVNQCIEFRVPIVFIESVAYQETLAYWLERRLEELGLKITVIPIGTGVASKYRRIKAWVKQLVGGKWFIVDKLSYNLATFQLYKYKTDRTDNTDDVLDVLAQARLAITKHYKDIIQATPLEEEVSKPKAKVMRNNTSLDRLRRASR